ncbi:MAG TPA: hypothetical protein PL124_13025 [Candidatus Cloacimonadota bacterium]|nr:hypothetical protein [Candidatus Cloacimonadota bacterium]
MSNISHEVGATIKNLEVTGETLSVPSEATLAIHLHPDSLILDGSTVDGWNNDGTFGETFTAAPLREKPVLGGTLNGHNSVRLDGADNSPAMRNVFSPSVALKTIVFVSHIPSPIPSGYIHTPFRVSGLDYFNSQYGGFFYGWGSGANPPWTSYYWLTNSDFKDALGNPYKANPSGEWRITAITYLPRTSPDPYVIKVRDASGEICTSSTAGYPFAGMTKTVEIGHSPYGGDTSQAIEFCEFMAWTNALADADMDTVILYLKTKYGLT